jgi:hypothetical protein
METLLLIVLSGAVLYGLHRFAQWADRDTRLRQRLEAIRTRNAARDFSVWEQSRMKDRAQPETVDAMVIRHLRGGTSGRRTHG